jgi:hypothetical protein
VQHFGYEERVVPFCVEDVVPEEAAQYSLTDFLKQQERGVFPMSEDTTSDDHETRWCNFTEEAPGDNKIESRDRLFRDDPGIYPYHGYWQLPQKQRHKHLVYEMQLGMGSFFTTRRRRGGQ